MTKICVMDKPWRAIGKSNEAILKNFLFESKEEIKCGDVFKYNGKFYSVSVSRPKENIAVCDEFTYKNDDLCIEGEITCPYCGSQRSDSWELQSDSEDNEVCETCGSTYSWERNVEVTYHSNPIKKKEVKEIN